MKTVEQYMSMGFDRVTAEYFAAGRRRIINVEPKSGFVLELTFDNGEHRAYDCRPLFQANTVFERLCDMSVFSRVYLDDTNCVSWDIDPEVDSTKVWSNKIDLSSDSCYLDSKPIIQ